MVLRVIRVEAEVIGRKIAVHHVIPLRVCRILIHIFAIEPRPELRRVPQDGEHLRRHEDIHTGNEVLPVVIHRTRAFPFQADRISLCDINKIPCLQELRRVCGIVRVPLGEHRLYVDELRYVTAEQYGYGLCIYRTVIQAHRISDKHREHSLARLHLLIDLLIDILPYFVQQDIPKAVVLAGLKHIAGGRTSVIVRLSGGRVRNKRRRIFPFGAIICTAVIVVWRCRAGVISLPDDICVRPHLRHVADTEGNMRNRDLISQVLVGRAGPQGVVHLRAGGDDERVTDGLDIGEGFAGAEREDCGRRTALIPPYDLPIDAYRVFIAPPLVDEDVLVRLVAQVA